MKLALIVMGLFLVFIELGAISDSIRPLPDEEITRSFVDTWKVSAWWVYLMTFPLAAIALFCLASA